MSDQPTPDSKDWTWVLDSVCDECGQDVRGLDPRLIAGLVRDSVPRFAAALRSRMPAPGRPRRCGARWNTAPTSGTCTR